MKNKKWLYVFYDCCIIVSLCLIMNGINYSKLFNYDKLRYKITTQNDISYKVNLLDNDVYDEDYLEEDNTYVSSFVKDIDINYKYSYYSDKISNISYSYRVDAVVTGTYTNSSDEDQELYSKVYNILPTKSINVTDKVDIDENVKFNFNEFNNEFIKLKDEYNLTNSIVAKVKLSVNIIGMVDGDEVSKAYEEVVEVPLTKDIFNIEKTKSDTKIDKVYLHDDEDLIYPVYLICGIFAFIISFVMLIYLLMIDKYNIKSKKSRNVSKINDILKDYEDKIVEVEDFKVSKLENAILVKNLNELLDIEEKTNEIIHLYENKKYKRCYLWIIHNNITYKYIIKSKDIDKNMSKDN